MLEVDTSIVKPWLIQHLEPITDAEPATLAEYVLALLQRDETPEELERICIESLGDFLEGHTDSFVREMLAFVRSPPPSSAPPSAPLAQRKRPLETDQMDTDEGATTRNVRPALQQSQTQNGGLAKGMCRDYHMRGFCARGQSCPYQHDAFATAQPPPGAFPQFQYPFAGPGGIPPQGQYPPGMRPGMPSYPMGFPPRAGPGRGMPPFGQPGFPPFGGPPQQQQQNSFNQRGPRNGGGPHGRNQQGPHAPQQGPFPPSPFPVDQPDQSYPQQPPNKRRSLPPHSYERPPRPPPTTKRTPSGPPPTPLTVLTHRFATNSSRQKALLTKLESCESSEEKKEVMTELRKLNKEAEEIMSLKKKVEEQEKEKEAKAKEAKEATGATEETMTDVMEGGKSKEDLKAHLEKLRTEAASLGILPGQTNGTQPTKPHPSKRPFYPHSVPRTAQSFRLDNRSTNILVEAVQGQEEEIKKHFEQFGTVKSFEVKEPVEGQMVEEGEERGKEILVGFESRAVAEKAMSSGPPPVATSAKLRWAPSSTTSPASAATPAPATTNGSTSTAVDTKMDLGNAGEGQAGGTKGDEGRARSVERPSREEDDDDERSWNR